MTNWMNTVHHRSGLSEQFELAVARIDSRFDAVDARFALIDTRFDRMDARFGEVEARLGASILLR